MRLGQDRKRRIVSHGERGLHAVFRHGENLVFDVFIGVTEHLVKSVSDFLRMYRNLSVGDRQCLQVQ